MIVGEADCPSVKMNETYRLQPALSDILRICTIDLLPPLGIGKRIGYVISLWYVSCLSLKPAVILTCVALARTGLIKHAAFTLMLCQQTNSSNLLLKQGTI